MMQKLLHNGTFSTMLNIFQLLISTPHSGHPSDFDTIMWCCCGGAAPIPGPRASPPLNLKFTGLTQNLGQL